MAADNRALRARSFGAIAEDYDRFRPGPPGAGVEWLLPAGCTSVVDIGAGTGALSRELVQRVERVTAVEPDARMSAVLAAREPRVAVVSGRAEELPLRARAVDAVVGSSMWHWVDEERAAAEAARVLRPGGVLGLLWGGPDRSQGWLAELLAGTRGESVRPVDTTQHRHRHEVHLPAHLPFGAPETHIVQWSLAVTSEQLVGLAGTYSGFIVLGESERARIRAALVEAVREHPAFADRQQIELPMRCLCWRAVRADR